MEALITQIYKGGEISAGADRGPRSHVCALTTLRSALRQHQRKFPPHFFWPNIA